LFRRIHSQGTGGGAEQKCAYFFGGPLEASDDAVFDFVKILHTLGTVDEHVGPGALGAETPDLTRLGHVVLVLFAQILGAKFKVLTRVHLIPVDVIGQTVGHGHALHVQTIVLVGRLGQTHLGRLVDYCFTIGHDRVGHLDGYARVIFLQIFETNFKMQLARASDNVLTRLFNDTLEGNNNK
jgi:hypothetical protein